MSKKLFSVYDSKSEAFNVPFAANAVGEAKRVVIGAMMDKSTSLFHFPEDYCLFEVGAFDEHTGVISSVNPVNHGVIGSFIPKDTGLKMADGSLFKDNSVVKDLL